MKVTSPLLSLSSATGTKAVGLTWTCVVLLVFAPFLFPPNSAEATTTSKSDRVPVTIKAVKMGTIIPTDKTIFTVKTREGEFVQEVIPRGGQTVLFLAPGKYLVHATGTTQEFPLLVSPPTTELTIQIPIASLDPTQNGESKLGGEPDHPKPNIEQQFWVGVFFAAVFVGFLMYSINKGKDLNYGQRLMLKILSTVCAAIGGALISGAAFLDLTRNVPGGKLTVSGTAGFAIFFLIWFTFPRGPKFEPLPDGFNMRVPIGWTFEMTADECARQENSVTQYDGFTAQEMKAPLKSWELHTGSALEAIQQLGSITEKRNAVRDYRVKKENGKFSLKVK